MPNPKDFKDQKSFMGECMHQTLKVEGRPRAQSIGQCLGMWRDRNKKKKKSKKKTASDILRMIAAKLGVTYKSNSVQLPLPKDLAKEIIAWGRKNIPDDNLVDDEDKSMGRENEIHITVLYGIEDDIPDVIEELLENTSPFEVTLGKITKFSSEGHEVIKIDIDSPELEHINYLIRENVSYNNKFPVYHPHCTVAYVKKGTGDNLMGDSEFKGKTFIADTLEFSSVSGKKTMIKISGVL